MKLEGFLSLLGCVILLVALFVGFRLLQERVKPVVPHIEGSSPP